MAKSTNLNFTQRLNNVCVDFYSSDLLRVVAVSPNSNGSNLTSGTRTFTAAAGTVQTGSVAATWTATVTDSRVVGQPIITNAHELFIKLMKVAFETGLPYLAFTDEINRNNPNKHEGNIYCVNLCVESFSIMKPDVYAHTCNLLSLVAGRIRMNELSDEAAIGVRILGNGIELTSPPVDESAAHNDRYRTVGVGILGLHDIIAREGVSFMNTNFVTEVGDVS